MTEPTITSQLLGVLTTFIGLFILMIFTSKNETTIEPKTVVIIEEAEDFREVARRNLKNCDRGFTYDSQPPVGLPSTIEDVPQDFRQCIEDYDRLASDYQEEAIKNDLLRSQNAKLLEENGRLLYKEMTMDFRPNRFVTSIQKLASMC